MQGPTTSNAATLSSSEPLVVVDPTTLARVAGGLGPHGGWVAPASHTALGPHGGWRIENLGPHGGWRTGNLGPHGGW